MLNQPMSSPMIKTMFGRWPAAAGAGAVSWLLRLCRARQSDGRERRSGDERATTQQEIAAFQSTADWSRAHVRLFRILSLLMT